MTVNVDEPRSGGLDRRGVRGQHAQRRDPPILKDYVDRDLIRVLDLLFFKKAEDGAFEAFEATDMEDSEIGEPGPTRPNGHAAQRAGRRRPGRDDRAGKAPRPCWSGRTCGRLRSAPPSGMPGARLVASGRIPIQAVIAAIESDQSDQSDESDEEEGA